MQFEEDKEPENKGVDDMDFSSAMHDDHGDDGDIGLDDDVDLSDDIKLSDDEDDEEDPAGFIRDDI